MIMNPDSILKGFHNAYPSPIQTVDSHTAGEPTRLIIGGLPEIPGATMAEKRASFMERLDHVRGLLTREPRGHRDLLAALLTPAVSPEADFGLIYMDGKRYPFLCGHATIGAVTTLIETGMIQAREPETRVFVDTPSGPMQARAMIRDSSVRSVAIRTVPSFVYRTGEPLDVPGIGTISVDTVCVGGFFVMVDMAQLPFDLLAQPVQGVIDLGMTIIDQANRQLRVSHPERPEVTTVDVVEFTSKRDSDPLKGRSFVVYGEAHLDRSPCGTGTAAKLTLMHHNGQIGQDQVFENQSPTSTLFQGRIVNTVPVGSLKGVEVEISGSAHITGAHSFVLNPDDPFPEGFLL